MAFRDRLLATIRAARPVLEDPGVLVVGSGVANLLEPGAAASLVVSQDLDVGVPVDRHAAVKQRLPELYDFCPSPDEPSVWTPGRRRDRAAQVDRVRAGRSRRANYVRTARAGTAQR